MPAEKSPGPGFSLLTGRRVPCYNLTVRDSLRARRPVSFLDKKSLKKGDNNAYYQSISTSGQNKLGKEVYSTCAW